MTTMVLRGIMDLQALLKAISSRLALRRRRKNRTADVTTMVLRGIMDLQALLKAISSRLALRRVPESLRWGDLLTLLRRVVMDLLLAGNREAVFKRSHSRRSQGSQVRAYAASVDLRSV